MTMFTAFFDDSGTHDGATNVACGGAAASMDQWRAFDADWKAVLSMPEYDLDYLHMKEMKSGKGKFAKFQHDLDLQKSLYRRLHALAKIRSTTFGCVVIAEDYNRVNGELKLSEYLPGGPFVLAACTCIYWLGDWMSRYHHGDDLMIVFDKVKCWGQLCAATERFFGALPIPGDCRTMRPLQIGDHFAWEMHRANHEMIRTNFAPRSVKFRGSFDALMQHFNKDRWVTVFEPDLRAICDEWGVKPR